MQHNYITLGISISLQEGLNQVTFQFNWDVSFSDDDFNFKPSNMLTFFSRLIFNPLNNSIWHANIYFMYHI